MAVVPVLGSTERLSSLLEQLFQGHGINAVRRGGEVLFPDYSNRWANGELFDTGGPAWQLDFRLALEPDRVLVESVSGIGRTIDERISDGVKAFVQGSFHVLLSAFFGTPLNDQVNREEWEIAGQRRAVFIGLLCSRFGLPANASGEPDLRFFAEFERALKVQPLPPGTHWVRLYHMRYNGASVANEVLLDNNPWPELQDAMAAFDWPVAEKYCDVRLFLVISDGS